jgi:hypothetical protein
VVVVPPGWEEMKQSGEIAAQIEFEEYAAAQCKQLYGMFKDEGEFPRTDLKRILLQVPLTVVTQDQLRLAVEAVLNRRCA